jgi:FtsZ-binding cell division protein ZapB
MVEDLDPSERVALGQMSEAQMKIDELTSRLNKCREENRKLKERLETLVKK